MYQFCNRYWKIVRRRRHSSGRKSTELLEKYESNLNQVFDISAKQMQKKVKPENFNFYVQCVNARLEHMICQRLPLLLPNFYDEMDLTDFYSYQAKKKFGSSFALTESGVRRKNRVWLKNLKEKRCEASSTALAAKKIKKQAKSLQIAKLVKNNKDRTQVDDDQAEVIEVSFANRVNKKLVESNRLTKSNAMKQFLKAKKDSDSARTAAARAKRTEKRLANQLAKMNPAKNEVNVASGRLGGKAAALNRAKRVAQVKERSAKLNAARLAKKAANQKPAIEEAQPESLPFNQLEQKQSGHQSTKVSDQHAKPKRLNKRQLGQQKRLKSTDGRFLPKERPQEMSILELENAMEVRGADGNESRPRFEDLAKLEDQSPFDSFRDFSSHESEESTDSNDSDYELLVESTKRTHLNVSQNLAMDVSNLSINKGSVLAKSFIPGKPIIFKSFYIKNFFCCWREAPTIFLFDKNFKFCAALYVEMVIGRNLRFSPWDSEFREPVRVCIFFPKK